MALVGLEAGALGHLGFSQVAHLLSVLGLDLDPSRHAARRTHRLDEAPVPLAVMAVEEAAANEGVAPKAVWRNVETLARSLAVHRQGVWV